VELNKTQLIESVFAGNSEMAARMRALDWSATALGPVEQWPHSLRTCVRIVLDSGYPMAISWGPDYAYLYNDGLLHVVGTKHPWALGRVMREVYPEAWDFVGPMFDSVMTRGQAASFLTDLLVPLHRNNYLEEVYFRFSASPIPDDTGNVGGVLSALLETTERVLEDRRRHVLRDLASRTAGARNEEEVWRITAETLGQDRLSLPFALLYEYRPQERQAVLAGASVETDEALRPPVIDCRSENIWRLDPTLARDGVVVELGDRAASVPVPNWPAPPKEASVIPIRLGEYGEVLGFLVAGLHPGRAFDDAYRQFIHRITEQITIGLTGARAFEQERQRAEALAELDRAKTTFFNNVSHEFRTPLTLMLGPLEEVQKEASERLSSERQEQLMTVHCNALRLLKLVNTLLDFSRIESGRMQASYQPTDLASFTAEIASAFDSAMESAGLRFKIECQPIAEPVYVDRDMWEKIVLNLLSNALKFTFKGEVALSLKTVDGAVELQVRDTGVGIPEEHRARVFERFHRIEGTQARTYEGTGIGLALIQELAKLHGGSVRVESAVGAGSTFTVTIPRGKEHLPAEHIQAVPPIASLASTKIQAEAYVEEAQQWSGDESGLAVDSEMPVPSLLTAEPKPAEKRELIILADDNADMRQYLIRLLGDRYEVHAVADGRQALEATRQLRPALVLTDVMMPHLDGFGLLRAIRDDSALASTPVILLSARAGEESRVEGLQADADDYLIKPFTARELLARVATHVKMANLRRETAKREERLRGEAELEKARTDLAHVARVMSLGSLAASITHEVNQPLSGIVTNSSTCQRMLAATPPNVEGALETVRRTIRDANRASDVIKRLRGLFTRGVTMTEPLDLNQVTEEVVALLMGELQRNQVVLRSELAEDLPLVMGDRVQLQQVVLNLLRNGSDAMSAVDDRPRHLVIKTERDDGERVRLSVKDVGVGFEPQAREKLFESFYTTKKDGMGVGLSISKSIIESHHGRLWADLNEGPGATFSFSIPCISEKNMQDGKARPATLMGSEKEVA
jgi:signal transduction histidine kinase